MQQLITDLEAIVSAPEPKVARIQHVADRLRAFIRAQPKLAAKFTHPAQDTYARRLLHRDAAGRFVIVAMAWGAGHGTPVHDHGTWGVVGMLQNRIAAWVYQRCDDGSCEGYAELKEIGYTEAEQGDVLPVVMPPDDEIHRLQNKWDEVAVGIHIYGRDIERCRRFDLSTNQYTWYELKYTDDESVLQP